jgi:hypothetical protein
MALTHCSITAILEIAKIKTCGKLGRRGTHQNPQLWLCNEKARHVRAFSLLALSDFSGE